MGGGGSFLDDGDTKAKVGSARGGGCGAPAGQRRPGCPCVVRVKPGRSACGHGRHKGGGRGLASEPSSKHH